ncbi:MAG: phage tail tape measure protein [Cetobacterium sp.]
MGETTLGVKIIAKIKDFQDSMNKVSKSLDSVSKKVGGIGKTLTTGLTVPLVGIGTVSAKTFMDFETSVAKVGTMLKGTGKTMNDVKGETKGLSEQFATSQTDIAEAMYQAISAGVDATKTQEFLTVALKASKGGFTDTATAVDGLTSVINSYGLSTDDAEKIANQMLITQNKGKTTFGELSSSIAGCTGVASKMNVNTKELFSSLAVLTANGISTSESVTGLKAILSAFAKPSAEATKLAKDLGIQFDAQTIKANGLMPTLQKIGTEIQKQVPAYSKLCNESAKVTSKMAEMEKQGQTNTQAYKDLASQNDNLKQKMGELANANGGAISKFATLFGSVEALNSVLILTSDSGASLFNSTMSEMDNNTTALDDAFNTMSNTTGVTLKQAFIDVQNALIQVGGALAPLISQVAQAVSEWAKWFGSLDESTQKTIITVAGLVAVVGPLLVGLSNVFTAVSSLTGGISKGISSLGKLNKKFKLTTKASKLFSTVSTKSVSMVTTGFRLLGSGAMAVGRTVMSAVSTMGSALIGLATNPITWIVLAIVGLVAVGVYLYKHWDEVKAKALAIWGAIKDFFSGVWDAIYSKVMEIWTPIQEYLLSVWQGICDTANAIWTPIAEFFSNLWQGICDVVMNVWTFIKAWLMGWWNFIVIVAGMIWTPIAEFFSNLWQGICDVATNIWTGICSFFTGLWNDIVSLAMAIWQPIASFFSDLWDGIKTVASIVWNGISSFFKACWIGIKGACTSIWNGIKAYLGALWEAISGVCKSVWNSISSYLSNLWSNIKSVCSDVWNGIKTSVSNICSDIWSSVCDKFNKLKSSVVDIFNGLKSTVLGIWEGIKSGIKSAINGIIGTINMFIGGINAPAKLANKIPGVDIPMIPSVPYLAKGGKLGFGGTAIVGEAGAEMVKYDGSGVSVTPLSSQEKKKGIGGAMGGSGLTLHIENFNNNREQDVQQLAEELSYFIKAKGLAIGRV